LLSAISPGAARAIAGRRRMAMVEKSIVAFLDGEIVTWCEVDF
jgi:hypothetical protein